MKRRVKVGEEFDAEIRLIEANKKARVEHTRERLALIICVMAVAFLAGAAILGFFDGEFSKLNAVWSVAGAIIGTVVGYYFRGSSKD
ncbi:MAG: hypothetical protein ABJ388_11300 [Alphaproteobacteria bacterium]|uniref:hypothetical protein n=1 Tax=Nisaea sp. TaxID=2024842 RepID=UPI0032670BD8